MKNANYLLILFIAFIFMSCSGSDTYRGKWKAMDESGSNYEIEFDAKNFKFTPEGGETKDYQYTQNSVNISNGVETYGIKLEDGRAFQINFPIADDESKGAILDANGKVLYTIGREDYVQYDELYDL